MKTAVADQNENLLRNEKRDGEGALVLKGHLFNVHGHGPFCAEYNIYAGKQNAEAKFSILVENYYFSEILGKHDGYASIKFELGQKYMPLGYFVGKLEAKLDRDSDTVISHSVKNISYEFDPNFKAIETADGKKEQEAAVREILRKAMRVVMGSVICETIELRRAEETREVKADPVETRKIECKIREMEKANFVVNMANVLLFES